MNLTNEKSVEKEKELLKIQGKKKFMLYRLGFYISLVFLGGVFFNGGSWFLILGGLVFFLFILGTLGFQDDKLYKLVFPFEKIDEK